MLNDRDKHLVKTAKSYRTFCILVEVKAIKSVKFLVTVVLVKGIRMYIEADLQKIIYFYY